MRAAANSLGRSVAAERRYSVTVQDSDAGARLDRVLAAALPEISRSRLKALLLEGRVTSAGAVISEPSLRVKPGTRYAVTVPAARPATPAGQAIPLEILFEDEHLIVINKPPGLVVHPAAGNFDGTLVNALIAHCGASLSGIGGVARPGIVHRLDKDTSGVMVAAKTDRAHAALSLQFAAHSIERAYRAIVIGVPRPPAGRIEGAIGRSQRDRKKMAIVTRGGKAAVTHYRIVEKFGAAASLIECRLETGRTHQIRVHLAHLGNPVLGDPVYGRGRMSIKGVPGMPPEVGQAIAGFRRQALHAWRLGFEHPESGRRQTHDAGPPADFESLVNSLECIKKLS